jgi:phosphoglycolate phosphatase-like HAD superfamily hydrolase
VTAAQPPPLLLLFDIDGTLLLKAYVEHRAALHDALREVHHIEDPGTFHVVAAGRTDAQIARAIALAAGVSVARVDDRAADVRDAACAAYARRCPDDLRSHVVPGVPDLLAELRRRDDVRLALLTGNYEPIARLKLRAAGLEDSFAGCPGAYGSDAEDRSDLPEIARTRAARNGGEPHPRGRTVVIGDTPNDIACARADRVRCVAVATGPYDADALAAAGADVVCADAHELAGALN